MDTNSLSDRGCKIQSFCLFADVVQGACDCEIECSCSKSNCTAGEYWLSGAGCVECPAGH